MYRYFSSSQQIGQTAFLDACEEEVGLPKGQIGNSEVGHMNIGAGRIVYQARPSKFNSKRQWRCTHLRVDLMYSYGVSIVHIAGYLFDRQNHQRWRDAKPRSIASWCFSWEFFAFTASCCIPATLSTHSRCVIENVPEAYRCVEKIWRHMSYNGVDFRWLVENVQFVRVVSCVQELCECQCGKGRDT